jgi:hypothetical protein
MYVIIPKQDMSFLLIPWKFAMVGIINPRNSSELEVLKSRAKKMSYSLSPGEEPPSDHTETNRDSKPAPAAATAAGNGEPLSGGAIAGIVIGAVASLSLIGLLFFLIGRKKSASPNTDSETTPPSTEPTESKAPVYPPPQSAFQDAAETDYRYSRYQPPDPNIYASNGRPMSSAMSEFNGPHGAWRESRQSTMTRPMTMPMPNPVELDNGGEANQRDMWNQSMQYQPDGNEMVPIYQQAPTNTMSSVSAMGTMSTMNHMGTISPTSPRNEMDTLVGDGYPEDEKRAF